MLTNKPLLPKVYIVYGPTASGKTSFAIKLAKKLKGEIINADSRQIYKYMNIGTNKEPIWGIPSHLFDITTPDKPVSLAEYQTLAFKAIEKILKRGKTPVIVGGTGLYINAIVRGYEIPKIKPDMKLRTSLEKLTKEELQKELKKINKKKFEGLNPSDQNNLRRLMRAIETAAEQPRNKVQPVNEEKYKFIFKKPEYTQKQLEKKIEKRVEKMFVDGLVSEVKRLLKRYKKNLEVFKGMGYKEVIDYLEGKTSLDEAKELIKIAHRQYTKRQETWFKKFIK